MCGGGGIVCDMVWVWLGGNFRDCEGDAEYGWLGGCFGDGLVAKLVWDWLQS